MKKMATVLLFLVLVFGAGSMRAQDVRPQEPHTQDATPREPDKVTIELKYIEAQYASLDWQEKFCAAQKELLKIRYKELMGMKRPQAEERKSAARAEEQKPETATQE